MSYQEIALELVKISRSGNTAKQDDVDDLFIKYLNKLLDNEVANERKG